MLKLIIVFTYIFVALGENISLSVESPKCPRLTRMEGFNPPDSKICVKKTRNRLELDLTPCPESEFCDIVGRQSCEEEFGISKTISHHCTTYTIDNFLLL